MTGLESLCTAQKVFRPLAARLQVADQCTQGHWDRYSVNHGSGIESHNGEADEARDMTLT